MTEAEPRRSRLQRLDERALPAIRAALGAFGRVLLLPFAVLRRVDDGVAGGRLADGLHRNRQLLALLAALIAFTASFVHLQRFPEQAPLAAERPLPDGGEGGGSADGGAVGPEVGADTGSYIEERTRALAAAEGGSRLAVVSFTEYVTAEEAAALLPDELEVHRVQVRIPADGADPLDVPVEDDLAASVRATLAAQREQIAEEEREFVRLLESDTVTDEEFRQFYEAEVERLTAIRNLIDSGAATVFAVVVGGDVATLRDLAESDAVRLVDLAPEGADPAETPFYGLLPDGGGTVSHGTLG